MEALLTDLSEPRFQDFRKSVGVSAPHRHSLSGMFQCGWVLIVLARV
jgi:hypothetical protein